MDCPTQIQKDYKEHLEQVKLSKRKQEIQRALMQKRKHDKNPIAGYDLSSFRPRYGKKTKMLVLWRKEPQKQILSLHKILPTSKAVLGATR